MPWLSAGASVMAEGKKKKMMMNGPIPVFILFFLPGIQGASRDCLLSYNIALLQLLLQTLHQPLRWSGGRGESEGEEKKGLPFEVQLMNYS